MKRKTKLHINQILKLPIARFGKEEDAIFMYNNFIIFLKSENKVEVRLNEFVKIRIVKIMPKFAIAELVTFHKWHASPGAKKSKLNTPTVQIAKRGDE